MRRRGLNTVVFVGRVLRLNTSKFVQGCPGSVPYL